MLPRVSKNTLVTPFHLNVNGVAAAANSTTSPASPGLTTYVTDIHIALGTVAAVVTAILTLTGCLGGTATFHLTESVGTPNFIAFHWPDGLPASAPNIAITVAIAALTGGGTTDIDVYGYQQ